MRCVRGLVPVAAIMAAGLCARAEIGTCDAVPAATLLLPYFEVDLSDDSFAPTTVLFINNASESDVIAHVSLWTDYGIATTAFDVTLGGGEAFGLNLRDIFDGLTVAGTDFSNGGAERVAAHTGQASPSSGLAKGSDYGDGLARGYVLVDAMNQANAGFPGSAGYFVSGGTGKASNDNVLWGDYIYLDPQNNFAEGDTLVHIEASSTDARVTTNGYYTFYGTLVNGTAADNREPLATGWAASYDLEDSYRPGDLVYWRDPKVVTTPVNPWARPSWWPLQQAAFTAHDEEGASYSPASNALLPLACGRLDVTDGGIGIPYEKGWIRLDLNATASGPLFGTVRQSWVSVVKRWEGRFATGHGATALAHAVHE